MNVTYSKQAEAYLAKQTEKQSARIKTAVSKLPSGDIQKLRGIENAFRLRVGTVRILFEKAGDTITVIKIDNRGDVCKRG